MDVQEPDVMEQSSSEVIELEINEDDILYYINDQDDNEIGFAIMEDGKEVEYFYETDEDFYIAEDLDDVDGAAPAGDDEDTLIEMEISEDDILYYLADEDDNEIGFAIMEDGKEVEYYYADDAVANETQNCPALEEPAIPVSAKGPDEAEALFTAEQFSDFKDNMVGLLKDGASLAKELNSTKSELKEVFDFLPTKKR